MLFFYALTITIPGRFFPHFMHDNIIMCFFCNEKKLEIPSSIGSLNGIYCYYVPKVRTAIYGEFGKEDQRYAYGLSKVPPGSQSGPRKNNFTEKPRQG